MNRQEIIAKIAEAFYLKRIQEQLRGDADSDWMWAEGCLKFFEEPPQYSDYFWNKKKEDYDWIEPFVDKLIVNSNLKGNG